MIGWIIRTIKNKKKKMVDAQMQQVTEHLQKFKKFQWIKGDHAGKITEFRDLMHEKDKDIIWVMFADGSRINLKKLDEYVLSARTEGELLDIPVANNTQQVQQEMGTQTSTATIKGPAKVSPTLTLSPVQALLKKQKPNPVDINMVITLNVPSAELYSVICGSFENAEDEIVDFVVASLDTAAIKETLKTAIKNYYVSEPK